MTDTNPSEDNNYAAPWRTLGEAIDIGARKFCDFTGRASRSEYWWFYGFTGFFSSISGAAEVVWGQRVAEYVAVAVVAVLLTPVLAAGARRLHDINRSGWWQLFIILPLLPFMFLTRSYIYYLADSHPHSQMTIPMLVGEILYFLYLIVALLTWIYWFTRKGKTERNRFDAECPLTSKSV